ncbi:MAG: hypothetical protein HQL37_05840 [Alphaproteobacteria bacterium]|nr:hypothetical protein [Alphaproteobacteria bacterium]
MVLALLVAGYSALYMPAERQVERARKFTDVFSQENAKLDALNKAKKTVKDTSKIGSVPDFLERINSVAKDTGVSIRDKDGNVQKDKNGKILREPGIWIRKLVPHEGKELTFDIEIIEDYFKFLRFSQLLESLDVTIHDIQVHSYDLGHTTEGGRPLPIHAISFSITPRNDAAPLATARLARLDEMVKAPDKRNPFQRLVSINHVVRNEIDLTWIYKLSGIGAVGGVRMATIESKEYEAGSVFAGMTVDRIESDVVNLIKKTDNGVEKYVIRFRKK